jgi:hypothetical protein
MAKNQNGDGIGDEPLSGTHPKPPSLPVPPSTSITGKITRSSRPCAGYLGGPCENRHMVGTHTQNGPCCLYAHLTGFGKQASFIVHNRPIS